jgi:hypothetical protein
VPDGAIDGARGKIHSVGRRGALCIRPHSSRRHWSDPPHVPASGLPPAARLPAGADPDHGRRMSALRRRQGQVIAPLAVVASPSCADSSRVALRVLVAVRDAVAFPVPNGFFRKKAGHEDPLFRAAMAFFCMVRGGGRWSLDAKLGKQL